MKALLVLYQYPIQEWHRDNEKNISGNVTEKTLNLKVICDVLNLGRPIPSVSEKSLFWEAPKWVAKEPFFSLLVLSSTCKGVSPEIESQ